MLRKLLYSLLIPFIAFTLHAQCTMLGISTYIGPCNNGVYTISGSISFSNPPFSGQLIIQTTSGQYDTLYPPFSSGSANYVLEDIPAIGGAQTISAYFTFFPNCSISINISNIPTCPCTITNVSADVSSCDNQTNTFNISGSIEFLTPPTSGILTVSDCSGNTQTFNPPFVSPINYSLNNITADATPNCSVTAAFSTNTNCSFTTDAFDYPQVCNCIAEIGTFTTNISLSNTLTNLCNSQILTFTSNNDFIYPSNIGGNIPYNPNLGLLIYSCPPTLFQYQNVMDDPCLIGIQPAIDGQMTINNSWGAGNTIYAVPVTLYNSNANMVFNPEYSSLCFGFGDIYPIRLLTPGSGAHGFDCQEGTFTMTFAGSLPAADGSLFTVQNIMPNSVSINNNTFPNNGQFTISGLQNGDLLTFDIVDDNGCIFGMDAFFEGPEPSEIVYPASDFCAQGENPIPEVFAELGGLFFSQNADLVIDPNTGEIDLQASQAGTYIIQYQTPDPICFSIASFELSIHEAQVVYQNYTICETDIPVVYSGFTFYESGSETLLFNDVYGCDSTVIITVEVVPTPIPVIHSNLTEGCTPLHVNFLNLTEGNYSTCVWDFGTPAGIVNQCGNLIHTFEQEGCFDVSLSVSNVYGCVGYTTLENLICTVATPEANFVITPSEININDPLAQFVNLSTFSSSCLWDFGDASFSNDFSPVHIYPEEAGLYNVTLHVFNEYCVDSMTQLLKITNEPVYYIPNAFTPNGDGVNDFFLPQLFSGFDDRFYTFMIFNRWGDLLFETTNHLQGWDGTHEGQIVPDGHYQFVVSFKHAENEDVTLVRGHVVVVR